MADNGNGCTAKHMKLLSLITMVVLAVCGATIAYNVHQVAAMEPRIRQCEIQGATTDAKLAAMLQSLLRIERTLERTANRGQ